MTPLKWCRPRRALETTMKRALTTGLSLAGVIVLVFAIGAAGRATHAASAGAIVDPSTLEPVPPNAVCRADGRQIICDTFVDELLVNEPIFDLSCGTVYETSHYHGAGTRWYVDRLVVRRHVAASLKGILSPTGAGPTVRISGYWSFWTTWTTPGDDATAVDTSSSGNDFKVSAPGFGVIIQDAGLTYPDGTHRGVATPPSPEVETALCAALTP